MSSKGGADGVSGFDLDPLRERALAGEVSAGELQEECRRYMRRQWQELTRGGRWFQDSEEADEKASQKLAELVAKHGQFLEVPERLAGYLRTCIENMWKSEARHAKVVRQRLGNRWPVDDPESLQVSDPHADSDYEHADARYLWEQIRVVTRRELAVIQAETCPFHLAGCPQRPLVLNGLEELLNQLDGDYRDILREEGRKLGYGTRNHEVQTNLVCCFEWWRYRIFRGTALDGPGVGVTDRLRSPIIDRLNVSNGRWKSSRFCSPEGARLILQADPKFGELLRAEKPEVIDYLKGGAN